MSITTIIFIDTTGSRSVALVSEELCSYSCLVKGKSKLSQRAIVNQSENNFFIYRSKPCIVLNTYTFHYFLQTLLMSLNYRKAWLKFMSRFCHKNIRAFEVLPQNFFLDKAWGQRLEYLARERAEVEHAFSWLSTLGGAFSALGDNFSHCAVMAGKISWAQLKLAIRLGDPIMKSRCYLFLAISIAQQGHIKKAKNIVRLVKKSQPCLTSICQGVSAHFYRLKMTRSGS